MTIASQRAVGDPQQREPTTLVGHRPGLARSGGPGLEWGAGTGRCSPRERLGRIPDTPSRCGFAAVVGALNLSGADTGALGPDEVRLVHDAEWTVSGSSPGALVAGVRARKESTRPVRCVGWRDGVVPFAVPLVGGQVPCDQSLHVSIGDLDLTKFGSR